MRRPFVLEGLRSVDSLDDPAEAVRNPRGPSIGSELGPGVTRYARSGPREGGLPSNWATDLCGRKEPRSPRISSHCMNGPPTPYLTAGPAGQPETGFCSPEGLWSPNRTTAFPSALSDARVPRTSAPARTSEKIHDVRARGAGGGSASVDGDARAARIPKARRTRRARRRLRGPGPGPPGGAYAFPALPGALRGSRRALRLAALERWPTHRAGE